MSNKKSAQIESIQLALTHLIKLGEVFAICPHCNIHLSYNEYELLKCGICNKGLKQEEVLFTANLQKGTVN